MATDLEFHEAQPVSDGVLALAHHPRYVELVSQGQLPEQMQKNIGSPWSPEMVKRSRRSTGATIAACRSAIEQGITVNLAGGTH